MTKTADIRVLAVSDGRIVMGITNQEVTFGWNSEKQKAFVLLKCKPDAQVSAPGIGFIPSGLFNKAVRQAAAIFRDREKRISTKGA